MTFEYLKFKIWLSQEWKELWKWNKKTFFPVSQVLSVIPTNQTSKNIVDKTFNAYFNDRQINRWQNVEDKGHIFYIKPPGDSYWNFVEYLLYFFVSLDKSVLLHHRCLMSKFPEILILLCRKIFFVYIQFYTKLFPIAVVLLLYKNLIFFFKNLISSPSTLL